MAVYETFIDLAEEDGVAILRFAFSSLADGLTLDVLNTEVAEAVSRRPEGDWVLDLSQVQHCSSALLGVLVNAMNLVRRGHGRLVLAAPSRRISRAIEACCLQRLFTMKKGRSEAVGYLRGSYY